MTDTAHDDVQTFAKTMNVSPANLKNWMDKDKVQPVRKYGNTNVYLISEMKKAIENHASDAKSLRAIGYVHPDQHRDVMDHRDRLAVALAERDTEIERLTANLNGLQAEYDAIMDNQDSIQDQVEREINELIGSGPITDAELDDAMELQHSE